MAIYYVDQSHRSASNANSGTESSPWLTIQHAASKAVAGDTIYVKAGVYKPFEVVSSGTAEKPIVFAAYPGDEHLAIIDGAGTSVRGAIQAKGESHFTISGFRIQNARTDGIFIEGSKEGARDILITGNQIEGTGNSGIYAAGLVMGSTIGVNEYRLFDITIENNEVTKTNIPDGGNEAISLGGGVDGFAIRNNWVHHSQQYGIDVKFGARNGEIANNVIHDIEKHGIYLDTNSRTIENVSIHDNTIFNNANGIVLARESARLPPVPNMQGIDIYDNLVYDNARYGIMAYKHIRDTGTGLFDDVAITSNTVHGNGINGIRLVGIGDFATNFSLTDNTIFDNGTNIINQIGAFAARNLVSNGALAIDPRDGASPSEQPEVPEEPLAFELHYNIGGGQVTTGDDIVFEPGPPTASGAMTLRSRTFEVSGTDDDALYSSYGIGDRFGFAVEVPEDGVYRVELHLAEIWHTSAGKRVFDVALEGQVLDTFDNIDVFGDTGARYAATTIADQVRVTDGVLNIEAIREVDKALINAFSVYYDTAL